MGAGEVWRSLNKRAFVKALQKLMPSIRSSDLHRGRAGVRAQAVDESGRLIDDFLIEQTEHAIHVLNALHPLLPHLWRSRTRLLISSIQRHATMKIEAAPSTSLHCSGIRSSCQSIKAAHR